MRLAPGVFGTSSCAPALGMQNEPLDRYPNGQEPPGPARLRLRQRFYTQPISFIGLPVAAVPVPLEPLPIGVQIIAAPWREHSSNCFKRFDFRNRPPLKANFEVAVNRYDWSDFCLDPIISV
jgi:hypothetical protein